MTERKAQIFFEVHKELPREGPGSRSSTQKALSYVVDLPPDPRILDVGCGPGAQTLCLAESCRGRIVAVDNHEPFLAQLARKVEELKLSEKITPLKADMNQLPFEDQSFDLIWAEGSIFVIGMETGLAKWRPLLRSLGYLAFTEVSWIRRDIPDELGRFWQEVYPAISTIAQNEERIEQQGYELLGDFILPESDWWQEYYRPIEAKLPHLREKHKGDAEALEMLALEEKEIELYRRYASYYGYVFYIARRVN